MKANRGLKLFTRAYLWVLGLHIVAGCILLPASVFAQSGGGTPTNGNAPVMNRAVQGQSAAGVEGTVYTIVNYISNTIAPLGAAVFFVHGMLAWHNGKGATRSFVVGGGMLGVSMLLRLVEWVVNTGQAGIQ